jgi:hypothetical protein
MAERGTPNLPAQKNGKFGDTTLGHLLQTWVLRAPKTRLWTLIATLWPSLPKARPRHQGQELWSGVLSRLVDH